MRWQIEVMGNNASAVPQFPYCPEAWEVSKLCRALGVKKLRQQNYKSRLWEEENGAGVQVTLGRTCGDRSAPVSGLSVPEHVLWLQFQYSPRQRRPCYEKILRTFQNQPCNLFLPKEPHARQDRQGCWCQELSWGTAEFPPLAPHLSVKGSAGVIPCGSYQNYQFISSQVSFAKAGGGKGN